MTVPAAPAEPSARLTWEQVRGWRCRRHRLDRPAELTAWARVDGLATDAVSRALWDDRTLVKTWAMRGTLHLLPAAELPLWQAGFATFQRQRQRSWLKYFGVTADDVERLLDAVSEALDGRLLTRDQLADEVGRITGSPALGDKLRESWGALLKPAAFEGRLCFGPSAGRNVRFTRPDQWLAQWQPADPAVALPEITRRVFAAHGPATREDFARWWGSTPAAAGRMIAALGDEMVIVAVHGTRMQMLAADMAEAAAAEPSPSVRLLPAFDHYVVAATGHATELMPGPFRERVYRPQGWLSPVLLVGGRMDGVWSQTTKGGRLSVRVEPFTEVPAPVRRAAAQEAERLAAFVGAAPEVTWA